MKDDVQNNSQFPDSIKHTLDICAKAIIIIPAGSFFISIGCNAAFFAGAGIGLLSIPFSIYDFIMAFRMWLTIFLLLITTSAISHLFAKVSSHITLASLKIINSKYKLNLTSTIIKLSTTVASKRNIIIFDLFVSIIAVFTFSFIKGERYSGNYGTVYIKNETKESGALYGNIMALDKGIIVKDNDNNVIFVFSENIRMIKYTTYTMPSSEKLINLL